MLSFAILYDVALLAVGLFALVRGDRPERIGALVLLLASVLSSLARLSGRASWEAGGLTLWIDVAAMASFFWLACRTIRFWPIWNFGLVLGIVAIDLAELLLPRVGLFVFASSQIAYAYLTMISLAVGTAMSVRTPRDPHHGFRPCKERLRTSSPSP